MTDTPETELAKAKREEQALRQEFTRRLAELSQEDRDALDIWTRRGLRGATPEQKVQIRAALKRLKESGDKSRSGA